MRLTALLGLAALLCAGAPVSATTDEDAMAARINAQLESSGRDRFDAAKDPGRKPVAFAQFSGIEPGMTALDLITVAGYNAELLAAAVGPDGIVYAQNTHYVVRLLGGAHHQAMLGRLENDRLPNVRYIIVDTEDMPFDENIDIAFWGTNMHDVYNSDGHDATIAFLLQAKRALKPGAALIVTDHVGIAGQDNAELHRIEPRIAIAMLEEAGFVIEETSDLLAEPDDDHTQSVFEDGLRYHTDRFLVRARKPK